MLATSLRPRLDPAPEPADAAIAAAPSAPMPRPAPQAQDRRGPLRPERLAVSRRRSSGQGLARLFRTGDAAALLLLAAAFLAVGAPGGLAGTTLAQAAPLAAAALVLLKSVAVLRGYRLSRGEPFGRHVVKLAAAAGLGGIAGLVFDLAVPGASGAGVEPFTVSAFLLLTGLHAGWWLIVRSWRRAGRLTPNIVIVGATPNAERLLEAALKSREVAVLGVFDDRLERTGRQLRGVPVLGDVEALLGHRLLPFVDKIVITVTPAARARVRDLVDRLSVLPNPVTLLLEDTDAAAPSTLARIADAPLAFVSGAPSDDLRATAKRAQDLVIGALALVLAAPVMLLIALLVRLDSPGPVLFRQRREGFNNETIVVWKFRSMRNGPAPSPQVRQVTADDPRITRVGRFIRRTSLDELPQLFNVLKGDMSLVGPRPHAPGMMTGDVESRRLVAEYAHRHRLKPGITGWAAIHGSRGPVDTPEQVRRRVELDLEYVERQSFWLDLYILAATLPCLLGDRAAVR